MEESRSSNESCSVDLTGLLCETTNEELKHYIAIQDMNGVIDLYSFHSAEDQLCVVCFVDLYHTNYYSWLEGRWLEILSECSKVYNERVATGGKLNMASEITFAVFNTNTKPKDASHKNWKAMMRVDMKMQALIDLIKKTHEFMKVEVQNSAVETLAVYFHKKMSI